MPVVLHKRDVPDEVTMATYEQTPGKLNVTFNRGDDIGLLLDFDIATAGYTLTAEVYSLVDRSAVASPTVTVVDASVGKVNISLNETETASLASGSYGIKVTWIAPGGVTRRTIEGLFEVAP